jgi:hypothetical protein
MSDKEIKIENLSKHLFWDVVKKYKIPNFITKNIIFVKIGTSFKNFICD